MLQLKAKIREPGSKLGSLRDAGDVPAVLYGPERDSTPVSLVAGEFTRVLSKAGTSTLVEVVVEGEKEPAVVIIRDVQRHPVKNRFLHVDLMAVKMGETMTVEVPIEFVGEPPVEKQGEGVVTKELREIEIEALPKDLPHEIVVDLSGLAEVGDTITIADLKLPEGVEALNEPEALVANAIAIKEEEVEEGAPGEALSEAEMAEQAEDGAEGETKADDAEAKKSADDAEEKQEGGDES